MAAEAGAIVHHLRLSAVKDVAAFTSTPINSANTPIPTNQRRGTHHGATARSDRRPTTRSTTAVRRGCGSARPRDRDARSPTLQPRRSSRRRRRTAVRATEFAPNGSISGPIRPDWSNAAIPSGCVTCTPAPRTPPITTATAIRVANRAVVATCCGQRRQLIAASEVLAYLPTTAASVPRGARRRHEPGHADTDDYRESRATITAAVNGARRPVRPARTSSSPPSSSLRVR